MLMSVVVLGKRYSPKDYGAMALVIAGLVTFILADAHALPVFDRANPRGLQIVC